MAYGEHHDFQELNLLCKIFGSSPKRLRFPQQWEAAQHNTAYESLPLPPSHIPSEGPCSLPCQECFASTTSMLVGTLANCFPFYFFFPLNIFIMKGHRHVVM